MATVGEFINIIKNFESIWNMKHPDFKNRKNKAHLWNAVSKEVRWTVEDCKKKWKGLRDSFFRENAKYVMSEQEAENQTGKWAYYNNLKFLSEMNLRSRIQARKYLKEEFETTGLIESLPSTSQQQTSFIETLNSSEEASFSSPSLPPTLAQPSTFRRVQISNRKITNSNRNRSQVFGVSSTIRRTRRSKKRLNIKNNILETMCNVNTFMQQHQHKHDESDDEDTLFCKIIIKKLKKIPLHKKNKLKVTLLTMLNEVEEQSCCESQNIKTFL